MPSINIAVSYSAPELQAKAEQLANQLQLPMLAEQACDLLLIYTAEGLQLKSQTDKTLGPVFVDFNTGKLAHRAQYGGGELITKAVGLKSKPLSILDATAGLGGDAFILAQKAAKVLMCERSPIIAALLHDGLARLDNKNLKLTLMPVDAIEYLNALQPVDYPDVIYCDPMYPEKNKSALPRKEMRILRQVVGDDLDIKGLLNLALTRAKKRVVLKRPRKSTAAIEREADIVFRAPSTRFDVWLV
ncbi:MAG: class I SAM-dependent methyltransferase [Gammaproteobacteria bacterium]|nr:class I SAM-dependent methyltransferase [Gammaproteobacteria bacterium]